jgi:hypothetical protein
MPLSTNPHKRHGVARKKFARIQGKSLTRVYCVDDDADWEAIRELRGGQLICHRPDCNAPYKKPIEHKATGLRFLAAMPDLACRHGLARPDLGGGPMSEEHQWLQGRLYVILRPLLKKVFPSSDIPPIIEHSETRADVYVAQAKLALEVQRWPTDFQERTEARQQDGGQVIWLVTEGYKDAAWKAGLMSRVPAVIVAVEDPTDRSRRLFPWKNRQDHRVSRLRFYGTVAQMKDGRLTTRSIFPHLFFHGVLSGERVWYPPGTPGVVHANDGRPWRSGFWALRTELAQAQSDMKAAAITAPSLVPELATKPEIAGPTSAVTAAMSSGVPLAPTDPLAGPDKREQLAPQNAPQPVEELPGTNPFINPKQAIAESRPNRPKKKRWGWFLRRKR